MLQSLSFINRIDHFFCESCKRLPLLELATPFLRGLLFTLESLSSSDSFAGLLNHRRVSYWLPLYHSSFLRTRLPGMDCPDQSPPLPPKPMSCKDIASPNEMASCELSGAPDVPSCPATSVSSEIVVSSDKEKSSEAPENLSTPSPASQSKVGSSLLHSDY